MSHFVYILANRPHGAIYIGSARDLRNRIEQHRSGVASGHTSRYAIKTLVYFERYENAVDALHRERRMKRWHRAWKDKLIEGVNPGWCDVCADISDEH